MDISNSELETFLRCRRMWGFESINRMNLRTRKPMPHLAFYTGEVVHKIMEQQVILGHKPDIDAILNEQEKVAEERYADIVGARWSTEERQLLQDSRELVTSIMNHYFRHWGSENPLGNEFRYLKAEVTFRVPIPDTEHHLVGTIDGIAERFDGTIYLVEHKTTSVGFPKPEELQVSRQLQAYTWAASQLLETPVSGIIYDGILKKAPLIPRVLKDGTLSRQIVATTPEVYRLAIQAMNLNEADYTDVIASLRDDHFFQRHIIRFTRRSLELFGEQLRDFVVDMANPNLPLYPNFQWSGCWDCRFRDLCTATQLGEDTQPILELNYQRAELSPSRRKEQVAEINIDELRLGGPHEV